MTTNLTTLRDICEEPTQFCYPQQWLSEAHWGGVVHVSCPGGSQGKTEQNLISGDTLPGHQFMSHRGQAVSRGTQRHCYPETLSSQTAEGFCQWTALGYRTGLMVSCQQAHFGRGRGINSNCTPSSGAGLSFAI